MSAAPEPDCVDLLYRIRFEVAETRYAQMKTRVNFLEDQQRALEEKVACVQSADVFRSLPLNPVTWDLINELKLAKEEIERLSEINRSLRAGVALTLPVSVPPVAKSVIKLEAELATAMRKITCMDMELARMNDLRFEDDLLMREYDAMWDYLVGREQPMDSSPVPPRFLPVSMCQDPLCKAYINRLRNGMRQAVAEVVFERGWCCPHF